MGDTDTVAVQYEVERGDMERLIRISQTDSDAVRRVIDEMLDTVEAIGRSDGPVGVNHINQFTRTGALEDKLVEWDRLNTNADLEAMIRLDVYEYLGAIEKTSGGYGLPNGADAE